MGRPPKNPLQHQEQPVQESISFEEEYFKKYREQNVDHKHKGSWQKMYAYYIDLIFKYANKTVLDLGCAFGSISSSFADRKTNVIGVDISKYATENSPFNNVKIINKPCWDLSDIPDNSIDFVHSMYMFEYVPPDKRDQLFSEIKRVCKPDALVFVILELGIGKKDTSDGKYLSQKFEWDQVAGKYGMQDGARGYYKKLMDTRVPGWEFMAIYHWAFLCYKVTKQVETNEPNSNNNQTS